MFGERLSALGYRCGQVIAKLRKHQSEPSDRYRSKFSDSRGTDVRGGTHTWLLIMYTPGRFGISGDLGV